MMLKKLITAIVLCLCSVSAYAGACDYRPSEVLGNAASAAMEVASTAMSALGIGMKAQGLYAIVHSTSGLTMLGSTAAGPSAAGTVGIIGGTGGAVGTVGAILLSPITMVGTAIIGIGAVGFEAACEFGED